MAEAKVVVLGDKGVGKTCLVSTSYCCVHISNHVHHVSIRIRPFVTVPDHETGENHNTSYANMNAGDAIHSRNICPETTIDHWCFFPYEESGYIRWLNF